ncbi:MAG: PEP-CTERM sorting domain-containing protein [Luteolibacter sp.]
MKSQNRILLFVSALSALTLSANAATINIDNLSASDAGNTVSGFTVTGSLTDDTYTFSFTQTGDLDGGLGGDDTLEFDLIYNSYTGSTFDGTDVTLGTTQTTARTTNVNWHSNGFDNGNTLSLQIANVAYTSAESTVAFNGFTQLRLVRYASTPAGDIDYYVGLAGATTVTVDPSGGFGSPASLTSNGTSDTLYFTAADGPARLRNADFNFETSAIPEPTTPAMILGGLGMLALIRRRQS